MKVGVSVSAGVALAMCAAVTTASAQDWLSPRPVSPAQSKQQQTKPQQRPAQAQQTQAAPPAARQQQAGPELIQSFGDWRISCVSRPGRACQITQRQVSKGNRAVTLVVELTLATQPKPRSILSVVTPLGSKLSPSVVIRGDRGEVAAAPLLTCVNTGCIHSGDIVSKQVEGMRRAKKLSTQLTDLKGQSSALAISTNGLEDAFRRVSSYLKGG